MKTETEKKGMKKRKNTETETLLARASGIIEQEELPKPSPLQEKECPRCHSMNAGTNEFCGLCGLPFDQRRLIEQTLDEQKLKDEVRVLREEIMKTEGVGEYLDHLQIQIEELHRQLAMQNNGGKAH